MTPPLDALFCVTPAEGSIISARQILLAELLNPVFVKQPDSALPA